MNNIGDMERSEVARGTIFRPALAAGQLRRTIPDETRVGRPGQWEDGRPTALPVRPAAVILLGGAVRQTALRASIGRSVVDLPVEVGRTLIDCWIAHCLRLAEALEVCDLPVRLILDRAAPEPRSLAPAGAVRPVVERDGSDYRGTGGVLHDVAACYSDDDYILVGNAAQLLCAPVTTLCAVLAAADADISLVAHDDGTPSGLMLVRPGCLRSIPPLGFVDLKEQALPAIAARFRVKVVHFSDPTAFPVRTRADYIEALVRHNRSSEPRREREERRDWQPAFGLVEEPRDVGAGARIHESVVLRGGRVEAGAVLVRSVVCPGAVVRRGAMVVDELVAARDGNRRAM